MPRFSPGSSLSHRLYLLLVLFILSITAIAGYNLYALRSGLIAQKETELRHLAESALSIAREEQTAAARGEKPDEAARRSAAARIGGLRYGQDDYFWINDTQARMIMHPTNPRLNGQDLSGFEDPTGKRIFIEFARLGREGGGVLAYLWPKPGASSRSRSSPASWASRPGAGSSATGVYIDDLETAIWNAARTSILVVLLIAALASLVFWRMAKAVSSSITRMTGTMNAVAAATCRSRSLTSAGATRSAPWRGPSRSSRSMPSSERAWRAGCSRRGGEARLHGQAQRHARCLQGLG